MPDDVPSPPGPAQVPPDPIELRVHGVSGTPPESLLDRPLVTQVGGDAIAGFYRPRLPDERTDDRPTPFATPRPNAPEMEGYNWGGLTSGSPGRALWLFLLPFTLINIAPRARPVPDRPDDDEPKYQGMTEDEINKAHQHAYLKTSAGLTWLFSRWLGLMLTLLLVVTTAGIGVNLIGWQCSYSDACSGAANNNLVGKVLGHWDSPDKAHHNSSKAVQRPPRRGPMAGHTPGGKAKPGHHRSLTGQPNPNGTTIGPWHPKIPHRTGGWSHQWLLFVGTLIPILMLLFLWFLSKRTIDRYESVRTVIFGEDPRDVPDDNFETNLDSKYMWHNQHQVRRIRATHMQAGFAAALWIGAEATASRPLYELFWPGNWSEDWLSSFVAIGLVLVLLYSFGTLMAASYVGHRELKSWQTRSRWVWLTLIAAGVLMLIDLFSDGITERGRPAPDAPSALPGFEGDLTVAVLVLFGLTVATILVVAALAWKTPLSARSHGQQQPLDPPVHGMAAGALASMAVLVGAIISASAFAIAAAWLNSGSIKPGPSDVSKALGAFDVPVTFKMAVFVFLISIGFAVLVAVVAAVRTWVGMATPPVPAGAVARDYGPQTDADRKRSIEQAMFFGAMIERGLIALQVLVLFGIALTIAGASFLPTHGSFMTAIRGDGKDTLLTYEAWGAYSAVLTLLGLVALTSLAFRVPATRKGVGIIWDVASFWPRACHPLAAPCYAERTVPDLVTRLDHYRVNERPVILAAHSQGTVISMAALSNLKGRQGNVDGLSLLTFGCVLRRLYARFFPVYFGTHRLKALQEMLTPADSDTGHPRWINLWRYTDYLGGQVTAGPPQQVPTGPYAAPAAGLITTPPSTGPAPWEWHAPDPPYFKRQTGQTTFAAPSRHSNFWKDESGIFQLAIQRLTQ